MAEFSEKKNSKRICENALSWLPCFAMLCLSCYIIILQERLSGSHDKLESRLEVVENQLSGGKTIKENLKAENFKQNVVEADASKMINPDSGVWKELEKKLHAYQADNQRWRFATRRLQERISIMEKSIQSTMNLYQVLGNDSVLYKTRNKRSIAQDETGKRNSWNFYSPILQVFTDNKALGKIQMLRGPPGEKGQPGGRGKRGKAGPRGIKGNNGKMGQKGDAGPAGPRGAQGQKGGQGNIGQKGDAGPIGPRGVQGQKGGQGKIGRQGDAGPIGPRGAQGQKGGQGKIGQKGDTGPIGSRGVQGQKGGQGKIGRKGDAGPIGPRGVQGQKGAKGGQGKMGQKGDTGLIGPGGRHGLKALKVDLKAIGCNDPGTGSPCRSTGSIKIFGVEKSLNGRGFNLVALNHPQGTFHSRASFDTYADPKASAAMLKWVEALPTNKIVLVSTKDEYTDDMKEEAIQALKLLGGKTNPKIGFRSSYALIGYKGNVKFNWIQDKASPPGKGPTLISATIII